MPAFNLLQHAQRTPSTRASICLKEPCKLFISAKCVSPAQAAAARVAQAKASSVASGEAGGLVATNAKSDVRFETEFSHSNNDGDRERDTTAPTSSGSHQSQAKKTLVTRPFYTGNYTASEIRAARLAEFDQLARGESSSNRANVSGTVAKNSNASKKPENLVVEKSVITVKTTVTIDILVSNSLHNQRLLVD